MLLNQTARLLAACVEVRAGDPQPRGARVEGVQDGVRRSHGPAASGYYTARDHAQNHTHRPELDVHEAVGLRDVALPRLRRDSNAL